MKRLTTLAVAGAMLLAAAFGLSHWPPASASQGSGCMPTTGTVSGLTFAQSVNAAIAALISSNSGASSPATDCSAAPVKGQLWLDTSATPNVMKQYDGLAWVAIGAHDAVNHLWSPPVGGGIATITAALTTDVCAAPAALQTINGSATIQAFGSACVTGVRKTLIFGGASTIVYNPVAMIVPGQANYTTSAGDVADAIHLGAGGWRIVSITRIDGSSVLNPAVPMGTINYGMYGTLPPKTVYGAGQALPRTSYPAYFAAATRVQTGSITTGNNSILSVPNLTGLGAGMPVEGSGIPFGTTISLVTGSGIVMSNAATANGTISFRTFITGYGAGGDSTTVGVPDCNGRTLAGRDNQGGILGSRLTSAYLNGDPYRINASGGGQSATLGPTNAPPYTPQGLVGVTLTDPGHTHIVGDAVLSAAAGGTAMRPYSGHPSYATSASSTTGITVASTSFAGTPSAGASAPFSIVPPTLIAECVVTVLP